MSREENHPEDKKLSAVKSWFTRSISFGGVHGSSTSLAAAAASKGQSEGNGNNGEDQDTWGGFNTTLKQLSMRWGDICETFCFILVRNTRCEDHFLLLRCFKKMNYALNNHKYLSIFRKSLEVPN